MVTFSALEKRHPEGHEHQRSRSSKKEKKTMTTTPQRDMLTMRYSLTNDCQDKV